MPDIENKNKENRAPLIAGAAVVVAGALSAVFFSRRSDNDANLPSPTTPADSPVAADSNNLGSLRSQAEITHTPENEHGENPSISVDLPEGAVLERRTKTETYEQTGRLKLTSEVKVIKDGEVEIEVRDGRTVAYFDNDSSPVLTESTWKDGLLDTWRYYRTDSSLIMTLDFSGGKLSGDYTLYHMSGTPWVTGALLPSALGSEQALLLFPESSEAAELLKKLYIPLTQGELDKLKGKVGEWTWYYPNGNPQTLIYYSVDSPDKRGESTWWPNKNK